MNSPGTRFILLTVAKLNDYYCTIVLNRKKKRETSGTDEGTLEITCEENLAANALERGANLKHSSRNSLQCFHHTLERYYTMEGFPKCTQKTPVRKAQNLFIFVVWEQQELEFEGVERKVILTVRNISSIKPPSCPLTSVNVVDII